jgi:hypothetical protein
VAWELPFGQGRKWMNTGGWKDALFGGWEMSLIFRYDSGVPLRITSNNWYFPWSGYPIYVNRNAGVDLGTGFDPAGFDMATPDAAANGYFNPAAFSNPAYGEFGEGPGRFEELRSHGGAYEDFGLMKYFTIGPVRAQLRLELINLFNRHYFDNPITDIGSPLFGQVISTGDSTPRQGQVALRFEW